MFPNLKGVVDARILCIIPCPPKDDVQCLQSVMNQTIVPEMVVLSVKQFDLAKRSLPEELCDSLNSTLSKIDLTQFDYILRLDNDAILPSNFIEENVKGSPDLCGYKGSAMLIKVAPFLKYMKGQFRPEGDDSYTHFKFLQLNLRVQDTKVEAKHKAKSQSPSYYLYEGKAFYKLGYEPVHVLASIRHDIHAIFAVLGYFMSMFRKDELCDVAPFVRYKQTKRLFRRK